ncbi:MAG: type II toxin-antitoxin system RelE/ParE family toxin [Ignavibacteria bacterium]|nr:type II toxin-antitoxin system RelE/ParE family toxin [Ignavibacteria bacterium]
MAARIVWTPQAKVDRFDILNFYHESGTPKSTLTKLDNKIRNIIEYLSYFPELGVAYKRRNARILYKDNYSIIYRIENEEILILQIWDNRQDPKNLTL